MSQLKTNLEQILQEKQTKIIPENIKKNVEIFGITGTLEAEINTSDATATVDDIINPKTAYVNGEKIIGTMPNNGELNYEVSNVEQTIHAGYTSGGKIAAAPISQEEYDICNNLIQDILGQRIKEYTERAYLTPLEQNVYNSIPNCTYIDTGIVPTNDQIISIDFTLSSKAPAGERGYDRLFGVDKILTVIRGYGLDKWELRTNDVSMIMLSDIGDVRHNLTFKNGIWYLDDVAKTSAKTMNTTDKTICLFADNGSDRSGVAKIHRFTVTKGDVILQDLIPVMDLDGISAMYDLITYKFFYNNGIGNFISG